MKLRLLSKKKEMNDYSRKDCIRFVVVDLDRSKKYPDNFICLLPKNIKASGKRNTKFERDFGDNSSELAKKLLERALRAESDREVKAEIINRLDLLKPKPCRYPRRISRANKYTHFL